MNQRGFAWGWIIFLLFIGLAVGVYIYLNSEDNIIETTQNSSTDSSPAKVDDSVKKEEITLEAVSGYSGTGTASRSTNSDDFVHTVLAELDPPAPGKFYEGWIVGPTVQSTGELKINSDGVYALEFTSSDDFSTHNSVAITEETLDRGLDGNPETHVLEGRF